MTEISTDTVRHLAALVGIRPAEAQLADLARGLQATLAAIDRCDALDLSRHEPAGIFRLSGGPIDAEL